MLADRVAEDQENYVGLFQKLSAQWRAVFCKKQYEVHLHIHTQKTQSLY